MDFNKWIDEDEASDNDDDTLRLESVDVELNSDWLSETKLSYDPKAAVNFDEMPPLEDIDAAPAQPAAN